MQTAHSGQYKVRTQLKALDTSMDIHTTASTSGTPRSLGGHTKLRKRDPTAVPSSSTGSPFAVATSPPTTPYTTYGETFPKIQTTSPTNSAVKIKSYRRKSSQEDQGRLDLSRSVAENEQLSGLGIYDHTGRQASEVTFVHAGRRGTHTRTTSIGSQVSNGSGSNRANQPFVHPMKQTPRPFTPPASYPASINDDETGETDDMIEEDLRLGLAFRSRRSMSISSMQPTPLSQSHTAEEFARLSSPVSHASLTLHDSGQSGKARRPSRPRLDTDRSADSIMASQSRTSLEKAVSLVPRRSETEPQSRDDRIRAARRKFEEREASKELKRERDAIKRREIEGKNQDRQRRKSLSGGLLPTDDSHANGKSDKTPNMGRSTVSGHLSPEKLHARSYDDVRPTHKAALPRLGDEAGMSEKSMRNDREHRSKTAQSNWVRFSAWLQTRLKTSGRAR
nr:hypothetical protein CFP56_07871 [Quercus suber]